MPGEGTRMEITLKTLRITDGYGYKATAILSAILRLKGGRTSIRISNLMLIATDTPGWLEIQT